jgi:hypothetical protein
MKPNEITLVGWVDEALKQSFTKNKSSLDLGLQVMTFQPQGNG